jgi:hypothetical protein
LFSPERHPYPEWWGMLTTSTEDAGLAARGACAMYGGDPVVITYRVPERLIDAYLYPPKALELVKHYALKRRLPGNMIDCLRALDGSVP